jgi:hypothetical protein
MRTAHLFAAFFALNPLSLDLAQDATGRPDRTPAWVTDEVKAPRVEFRTFESLTLGAKVSYHVYKPAAYDQPNSRIPVLYWLHGTDGGAPVFVRLRSTSTTPSRRGRFPR